MFCQNCGKEVNSGDRFCENCGAKLKNEEASALDSISQNYTNENKERLTLWKILIACIAIFVVFATSCVCVYNSEWFINQTMDIKQIEKTSLGKNTKWNCENKYENGKLKIRFSIFNVDKKIMDIFRNYLSEDEYLIKLQLLDKEDYKIAEPEIKGSDFAFSQDGTYEAQLTLPINKNAVRKIENIKPIYREFLDIKYKDYIKDVQKMLKNFYAY